MNDAVDKEKILDVIFDSAHGGRGGTATILDFWDAGLPRGKPLHEALRELEAAGIITNRLERAQDQHRVYRYT
jgi:hypothetical protein